MANNLLDLLINPDLGKLSKRAPVAVIDSALTVLPAHPAKTITADGVSLQLNQRVLFTNLSDETQNNKIYHVTSHGSDLTLQLATDGMQPDGSPAMGEFVYVEEGTSVEQLWSFDSIAWTRIDFDSVGGSGTVTSVGATDASNLPLYDVGGGPVTDSGTLSFTLKTQNTNAVLVGPESGSSAVPYFRYLKSADLASGSAGTNGQVLTTNGDTASWATVGGGGVTWSTPINSNITADGDGTRSLGAPNGYLNFIYAYNNTTLETDYINSDGTQQYANVIANANGSDIDFISLNENTSGNTTGLQFRTEDNPSGNSKNLVIKTGTASGTRGSIKLVDGSEGTAGQVWTSTDTNGSGQWAAAGGGFTPEVHIGPAVTTNSSVFGNTWANISNSPTLTFTATNSGNFKLHFNGVISVADTTAVGQIKIVASVGSPVTVYENVTAININLGSVSGQCSQYTESIFTLVSGTSYSFDVQGMDVNNTATALLLNGSVGVSSSIIAERIT